MCTFHFMYLWYVDYKKIVKPLEVLLREVNVYFHFRTKVSRILDALRWRIVEHHGAQSHTIIIVLMLSIGVTVAKDVKCKVYPKNYCSGKALFLFNKIILRGIVHNYSIILYFVSDDNEGPGFTAFLITAISIFLIIITVPFSLCLCVKVTIVLYIWIVSLIEIW